MTRFEDLPPVDGEGWLADQGRNFLQSTDARISRLRLPNFLAESTRKIQGLGSDLGQMYQGLEQGLSSLPSQAQQASTNFLTSTTGRISGLGSQLGGLGQSVGQGFSDLGSGIRGSTDDLTELLERQREEAERRREDLQRQAGERYEGFQQGLQNVREADAGDIGSAMGTGLERVREVGRGQEETQRRSDVGFSEAMNRAAQRGGYEDVITPEETKWFREAGENLAGAGPTGNTRNVVDDVTEALLKGGWRATRSLAEGFVRRVGEPTVRRAMQGGEALGTLFDDYLARAAGAVPGGRAGPAGRLMLDETGSGGVPRLPGPSGRAPRPGDYDAAQRAIDDLETQLTARYGEQAVLDAPTHPELFRDAGIPVPDSPIPAPELARLQELHRARDAIGAGEDVAEVGATVGQLSPQSLSGPAPREAVEQALREVQANRNLSRSTGSGAGGTNLERVARDLYVRLSHALAQKGQFPRELAGDFEAALNLAQPGEFERSIYGMSPEPLLRQVRDILRDVSGQDLGPAFGMGQPGGLGGVGGGVGRGLQRLLTDETGVLRLPRFGRGPQTPPGATPGTPIPNPTTPAERAYNDRLLIGQGQQEAALTPEGPAPLAKGSTLATFDDWLSRQRELWTDESARLSDVQAAVRKKLGRDLTPDQNAMVRRRLYAGRQAASDQIIEDELQPILRGLSPARRGDVEGTMEQLDDVGRARAVQNQATARAAGQEVGPVAGETALRNTKQALRMRQARLAEALTQQDAADAAYKQTQADLKRVRAEGRRDILGSQGRGRRRVQRTPQEQARVEAEAQTKLDAARQGTVDARAARDEAAKGANVNLSRVTRADLKRMRLEWETDAARMAKEAELAEGAATKGAEAAAARRYSGGVTGIDYDEDAVWEATRLRVQERLDQKYAPLGKTATPNEVDAELAAVREATERLQGYSRQLRARLHEAGILSDELYEQWERDFPGYLRTNILKFMDEEAATPAAAGAQRFTVQSLVGGGQDVGARMSKEGTHALREQPVNTLVRMTYAAETLARRNENAQALKRLVEADPSGDLGKAFRPLKPGEAAGPKEAVFSVYENGEPQRFAVDKRFESLFNLPPSELRNGLDALGQFGLTGTFKAAVTTYNPAFIALNAMRDYLVYLRREAKNPLEAVGATRDLLRAYRDVGGAATGRARLGRLGETPRAPGARTEDLREAIRLGGGQDAGYSGLTPQQVRQRLLQEPDVAKRATVVSSLGQVGEILGKLKGGVVAAADVGTKATGVQALGRGIRGTGAVVEGAPRLAAYRRALARGATKEEAALAMRDVTMDFSRGGTRARDVNKAIPFFNAAIQGAARFYGDDLVNRRGVTAAQGLGLVVAKVGLDQYNQSYGDDYADVPDYLKDTGLVFMLPGDVEPERRADGTMVPGQRNFLWYPLPQDMAGVLKVGSQAYRRATGEKAYGFDTAQGWLETAGDVAGGLSPVDFEGGLPLPPLFRQLTEQGVNKDIFRDRPIVPEYLEGRPPEQQATPQTSALGRVVGGALGRVSPLGPTRVDYGVTGLLGGTGRQLLAGSDVLARAVGREDLASRPYSSPEDQGALDAVRGVPVLGPTVGAVVRQGGGEIDRREAQLLEREITDAQRAVTERLRAMPSFQRRSPDEQEALLRQEHDKIRRRLEEQGREARTQRQGLRARAQYRD